MIFYLLGLYLIKNLNIINVFLPQVSFSQILQEQKLHFAEIWDANISNKQRFFVPGLVGLIIGLLFILTDTILSKFHTLGSIPHPPFFTSLVASAAAAIGEEVIFP